jgi:hypothetical protein
MTNGIIDQESQEPAQPQPTLTPEQLRAALASAKQAQVQACERAVQAVLAAHHCTLRVGLIIRAGEAPEPLVEVIALPE